MLTPKQNVLECIKGGNPDRFVAQYEFMKLFRTDPFMVSNKAPKPGELNVVNAWGITRSWPAGTPGVFPVHDEAHIVCKDITHWRDYVKAPNVKFSDAEWESAIADYESVDRDQYFVGPSIHPGLFEQCHYLMEIQNCLMSFYEEPDDMHDLIKYLTDWELQYAEELCSHVHPSVCFHHDDWGTQISTFLSPDMFEEFYLDAYKEIYGYYKSHGVDLIVHHSDSYAETLVPYMIEMGIDIWQGVMTTNDIKGCIEKYGEKITFMGGIDSAKVDFPGWTEDIIKTEVRKACETYGNGGKYFIPSCSQGGPFSTFPGVYDLVSQEIDNMSKELFK